MCVQWKRVRADTFARVCAVENEYELMAVLEFNSTRKRQSVVIRQPDGGIRLYCKV